MAISEATARSPSTRVLWKGALKGEVYWPSFTEPNDMSKKYQFNLANLSDTGVHTIQSVGGKVTKKLDDEKKAEMGSYVVVKSNYPIKVVDANGTDMTGLPVGNGSKCRVACQIIELNNSFGTFVMVSPFKVVIDEVVTYDPEGTDDIDMDAAV